MKPRPSQRPRSPHSVSVVVPCYNYARYLRACVSSALTQDGVEVEVVVVDDCSSDESADVAHELAREDPRVRVLVHDRNEGPVATFNDGFAASTGDFLVRLDADDLLTPGCLARAVALFEAAPSVGLVYGHPRHFTSAEPPRARTGIRGWTVWDGHDWLAERCRRGVNCITSPEVVMRASVIRPLGGQREELAQTHDMEMWLRIAAYSDVARIDGPDQAFHRDHAESRSATMVTDVLIDLRERALAFRVLFEDLDHLADAAQLRNQALTTLAREALDRACRAYDRGKVNQVPVDRFVTLAFDLMPDAHRLPEWRALQARRRIGAERAPIVPTFFARAVLRRAGEELARLRWQRTGV